MGPYNFSVNFLRSFIVRIITLGLVLLSFFLASCSRQPAEVMFLSGAGMKAPVSEIVANFERETGIKVQTQFEGSSILRDYILDFRSGDVFLPGDKENLKILSAENLVQDSSFMAWHRVAILVSPQMKDRIKGLDDLAGNGVRLVISNPGLASLGKIVMKNIIERHPKGQDILKNVVVYGSSTQDVLRLYKAGDVDAIIEWDVMAASPEGQGLVVVPISPPYQVNDMLYAGLLTTAKDPALAKQFYDYLRTEGKKVFQQHGYDIEE